MGDRDRERGGLCLFSLSLFAREMQKVILGLLLALSLTIAMAAPAGVMGRSVATEVTVSTLVSFTIEDNGAPGLQFGSLNPGSAYSPEIAQGGRGAVTLLIGMETNVSALVSTRADNFSSGSQTMSISNAMWNISNKFTSATTLATSYANIATVKPGAFLDVWLWLSIPVGQTPGSYSTAYYYQAVPAV